MGTGMRNGEPSDECQALTDHWKPGHFVILTNRLTDMAYIKRPASWRRIWAGVEPTTFGLGAFVLVRRSRKHLRYKL